MSLKKDMKIILSSNTKGLIPHCSNFKWISWRICTVVCLGKIFHSNSNGSLSIPKNSQYSLEFWKYSGFFPLIHDQWLGIHLSKTEHGIWVNMFCFFHSLITLSCSKIDLIHVVDCHSIVQISLISRFHSKISFCVTSNNALNSSKPMFLVMNKFQKQPEMNCSLRCRWHEFSPDYHIDFWDPASGRLADHPSSVLHQSLVSWRSLNCDGSTLSLWVVFCTFAIDFSPLDCWLLRAIDSSMFREECNTFHHQIPAIKGGSTIHAQTSIQRNNYRFNWSVRHWRSFLTQPIFMGTNVRIPKIYEIPPKVDFESSRFPAKYESWNRPYRQCWAVLPTWQCCRWSFVWWVWKINQAKLVSQDLVHSVTARSSAFTDQRMPTLPMLAASKHWNTICEHIFGQLSNRYQLFFLETVVVHARGWDFEQLLRPSISYDHATVFDVKFQSPKWFLSWSCRGPRLHSSIILSFGLHSRWVHPKFTGSKHDVGSPRSTSFIHFFHMGAIVLVLSKLLTAQFLEAVAE